MIQLPSFLRKLIYFCIVIALSSCSKNVSDIQSQPQPPVYQNAMRKHDKFFVSKKDIKIWLSNQKGLEDSAINRNKFIDNIIADVETGALLASEWGEEGYIISVELKNVHSLHELPDSKKILVVFEDSSGSITRGELGIVTPEADTAGFFTKYLT